VKTKKAEFFTTVSTFDPLDLFDSGIITLEQWAYEQILFNLFGLDFITPRQWTCEQELSTENNNTGRDSNACSFGSAGGTVCALANRNLKILIALDISLGDR
jgi:hypothetical protein